MLKQLYIHKILKFNARMFMEVKTCDG